MTEVKSLSFEFEFGDWGKHEVQLDFTGAIDAGVEQTIELIDTKSGKMLATTTTASATGSVLNLGLRRSVTVRVTGAKGEGASVSGVSVGSP